MQKCTGTASPTYLARSLALLFDGAFQRDVGKGLGVGLRCAGVFTWHLEGVGLFVFVFVFVFVFAFA